GASTDQQIQANCTQAYTSCHVDPAATNLLAITNYACFSTSTNCHATVAQFVACINDMFVQLDTELPTLPMCAMLTKGALNGDAGLNVRFAQPASCTTFVTNCPEAQR